MICTRISRARCKSEREFAGQWHRIRICIFCTHRQWGNRRDAFYVSFIYRYVKTASIEHDIQSSRSRNSKTIRGTSTVNGRLLLPVVSALFAAHWRHVVYTMVVYEESNNDKYDNFTLYPFYSSTLADRPRFRRLGCNKASSSSTLNVPKSLSPLSPKPGDNEPFSSSSTQPTVMETSPC